MNSEPCPSDLDYVQIDPALIQYAVGALHWAKHAGLRVATAESCTGGLVATVLSEAPGAAEHFAGGFVTYTSEQKVVALGIDESLIEQFVAVSLEVAEAMAHAALQHSGAEIAVSVTGVAGPESDERNNPLGLVYLACARVTGPCETLRREFGDIGRSKIRYRSAVEALRLIARLALLQKEAEALPTRNG